MSKTQGNGATFQRWNGTTWDKICQVYSMSGIGLTKEVISDSSFTDDCSGTYDFTIKGKAIGSGETKNPKLDLGFDPEVAATNGTNQDLLVADLSDNVQTYYMITLPNAPESGFIFYGGPVDFEVPDIQSDSYVHSTWEFAITERLAKLGFVFIDDVTTYTVPAEPVGPSA